MAIETTGIETRELWMQSEDGIWSKCFIDVEYDEATDGFLIYEGDPDGNWEPAFSPVLNTMEEVEEYLKKLDAEIEVGQADYFRFVLETGTDPLMVYGYTPNKEYMVKFYFDQTIVGIRSTFYKIGSKEKARIEDAPDWVFSYLHGFKYNGNGFVCPFSNKVLVEAVTKACGGNLSKPCVAKLTKPGKPLGASELKRLAKIALKEIGVEDA